MLPLNERVRRAHRAASGVAQQFPRYRCYYRLASVRQALVPVLRVHEDRWWREYPRGLFLFYRTGVCVATTNRMELARYIGAITGCRIKLTAKKLDTKPVVL
jgi:hypothetical protein